jgi:hypothetical protein
MEFIRETTGSLPSTYKRGAIDDELHFEDVTLSFFLFPFIFSILYVRLCNIVSLSFRGCYMHTLVYISMCVYHQEAYSCWYPERSIQKEEEEEGKSGPKNAKKWKMKHATDTRYLFENDGEGMPLLLLLRYQNYATGIHFASSLS